MASGGDTGAASNFELYPKELFDAYREVMVLARDLNAFVRAPEIVFIGPAGQGRSSLIEAFLGHAFHNTAEATTNRPIHIQLISDEKADEPKITIKRDYAHKELGFTDMQCSLEQVKDEIAKRNTFTQIPLIIQYNYKFCWNMTIIDTPGLALGEDGSKAKEIEAIVVEQTKLPHRIIVAVEEAKTGSEQSPLVQFAKKVDPTLNRTLFCFSKFNVLLKSFSDMRDVNNYLMSIVPGVTDKAFFVTLVDHTEENISDKGVFRKTLIDYYQADLKALEQLRFDRRYEGNVGVQSLRLFIWDSTLRTYQDNTPLIQNRLRALKKQVEDDLNSIRNRLASMEISRMRSAASNYVMNFLQSIEKLISPRGNIEGNPQQNGQTLQEEKAECGQFYNYLKGQNISSSDKKVSGSEAKVFGGQQLHRLLAEFKIVGTHLKAPKIDVGTIATAAGARRLNNVSTYAWTACDLARQQSQALFKSLIQQLFKRAVYIMKRLPGIAEKMMAVQKKAAKSRKGAAQSGPSPLGGSPLGAGPSLGVRLGRVQQTFDVPVEEFPFFVNEVRNLYYNFVDDTAAKALEKCMDEFYTTQLIYFQNFSFSAYTKDFNTRDPNEMKRIVYEMAGEIFQATKNRLTSSVLLKCHNFFLTPMFHDLYSEIQGEIGQLSGDKMMELFEVEVTKKRLAADEKQMGQILAKFVEQERVFEEAAKSFSSSSFAY